MTKNEIRKNLILERNQLSRETVQKNSNSIMEKLHIFKNVKKITFFQKQGNKTSKQSDFIMKEIYLRSYYGKEYKKIENSWNKWKNQEMQ